MNTINWYIRHEPYVWLPISNKLTKLLFNTQPVSGHSKDICWRSQIMFFNLVQSIACHIQSVPWLLKINPFGGWRIIYQLGLPVGDILLSRGEFRFSLTEWRGHRIDVDTQTRNWQWTYIVHLLVYLNVNNRIIDYVLNTEIINWFLWYNGVQITDSITYNLFENIEKYYPQLLGPTLSIISR